MNASDANTQVFSDQVTQLYRVAPIGIVASLVNAAVLIAGLHLKIPPRDLLIWFAALFVVSLCRALLLWQYHRTPINTADCERWRNHFLAGLFAIGTVWGSVSFCLYPETSLTHQVFIAFLIGGMVAGAVGGLSFVPGTFLVFSLPSMGPLVARFMLEGDDLHFLMGVMLLLFCALLYFSSRKNVTMVRNVLSLKVKNTDLIADLEKINTELKNENFQRKKSQVELEKYRKHLEEMVNDRTTALRETNQKLQEEICQKQLIEDNLQLSNRVKSEFIAVASHELRTPLSSILGFSDLLLGPEQFNEEQQREFLQIIQDKAEALEMIIDDLLDLNRDESGHPFHLEKTRKDINQLIRHEVSLFQRNSPRHQFHTTFTEESVGLPVDVHKIERTLDNLLSNAVKYSPLGGSIIITAQKQGDFYQISVCDKGIGMTPDQTAKIFDKFYRADFSNTAVPGLGLGMSIVKQIVETHGGRIWVQSEPDRGTTVFFTLPLEEA